MNIKTALSFMAATILGGAAAYAGTALGGLLAGLAGLPTPALPPGADMATLGRLLVLTSALQAGTLALIAPGLAGSFVSRVLTLTTFTWIVYGVNNYIEAAIFTTAVQASPYVLFTSLGSSLLCSAAVAWLIPSAPAAASFWAQTRAFFARHSAGQWAWRLPLALASFPVAYVVFGMLVSPLVITYYEQQVGGLTLPGWGQILPVLALRTTLFLLACLPVLIAWRKSVLGLFAALAGALFMFVGGLNMLQADWLPVAIRIPHSLEILADSLVHAGALVLLLAKGAASVPATHPGAVLQPVPHR